MRTVQNGRSISFEKNSPEERLCVKDACFAVSLHSRFRNISGSKGKGMFISFYVFALA